MSSERGNKKAPLVPTKAKQGELYTMSIARKCTVEGCEKNIFCREVCQMHYARITRNNSYESKYNMDGLSGHHMYKAWYAMIDRCYNPNNINYHNYGGRGIKVCDRWRRSFKNFLEDVSDRPKKGYSIDRIDTNGNYEPSNCRWATQQVQVINRRMSNKNKTGFTGVFYIEKKKKWLASIRINGKSINLGTYDNINDAVVARKNAENKYWSKILGM